MSEHTSKCIPRKIDDHYLQIENKLKTSLFN